jgi:hypothetical protein
MIRNKEQIRKMHNRKEYVRRQVAEDGTVQSLTLPEIKELLAIPFTKEELRLEVKRRRERLRYLRIRANPYTLAQYRERKRNEYARRTLGFSW